MLDAWPLGRVMAGDQQSHPKRLGLNTTVKPRLAREERISAGAGRVFEEIVAGPAGDGHTLEALRWVTGDPHAGDSERPRDVGREISQRPWLDQPANAAGASR